MGRLTPEIEELVDQFCEGSLSAEQAGRLEALVGESDEWRQYLLESFQVHCELAWEFRRLREDSSQPAACGKIPGPDNSQRKRRRAWTYAAVAAALLIVALGLTAVFRSGRQENPSPSAPAAGIAQVSAVRGSDEKAPALHSFLPAGSTVEIQRGLLEMRLDGGVRMILQGPAEVELQSPAAAALRGGSLTVEVSSPERRMRHAPQAGSTHNRSWYDGALLGEGRRGCTRTSRSDFGMQVSTRLDELHEVLELSEPL